MCGRALGIDDTTAEMLKYGGVSDWKYMEPSLD